MKVLDFSSPMECDDAFASTVVIVDYHLFLAHGCAFGFVPSMFFLLVFLATHASTRRFGSSWPSLVVCHTLSISMEFQCITVAKGPWY